mmetsp:Transcript_22046/g.42089  ORF Transcript_22046/g.42089 Transcript_22046/m.42089 type:complete len:443 (+) Transcript_22046:181-1509(+)
MTDVPVDTELPPPSYASIHEGMGETSQPTPENVKFDIVVSDPVKQGDGVNAHVSYRVSTTTNLPQYRWSEFSVIRRFSDFVWLRARLAERNRGTIIPPLPQKGVSTNKMVFTISTEFIEARRKALILFLNRVAHHPKLCFSCDLQFFLEASEEAWAEKKQSMMAEAAPAPTKPLSNFGKMIEDFAQTVVAGSGRVTSRTEDPEHIKVQEYVSNSTNHTAEVRRQAERLLRRQKELGTAYMEHGEAMAALGVCEGGALKEAFAAAGNASFSAHKLMDLQASDMIASFEEPLKDATRHLKAVQEVMADREKAWHQSCDAKDEVFRMQARLAKLRSTAGKEAAVGETERALLEAQRAESQTADQYQNIIEQTSAEMDRFQKDRADHLKKVLCEFAMSQAQMQIDLAKSWQELIPNLDANIAQYAHPSTKAGDASIPPANRVGPAR